MGGPIPHEPDECYYSVILLAGNAPHSRVMPAVGPLAAAILSDESLATFDTRTLAVGEDEGPDSGRLMAVASGPAIRWATWADGPRFEQLFLDTLNAAWP